MKTLKEYLKTDKKFKNLKVPVRRKAGNYTLSDRIKGKKPKTLITRVDMEKNKQNEEAPANAIAHGGVDMAPNMGPKFGWIDPTDKRRKKNGTWTLLRRSGIQKRFKENDKV